MIRNAALLSILLAAPVVAAAEPPNPMTTSTPTPGPKIDTDLKVAPGILLRRPKPAACPGAKSTDILLSSCSGAPGTHLTLTTTLGKNVSDVQVLFKQNAGSKMTNYSATVGHSAGAYTLTVPPLCNGGSPSFSLVASYITLVQGRASVTKNLGNFTAICGQTAQATASPAPKPTASPTPPPPVPATVQAAVDLLTGSRDAVSSSSCGSGVTFNCPNGTAQSTKIRIVRNAVAITQNPAGSYSFSATVSATSLSDIPFTYLGGSCTLTINTAQGSSTAIVTGTLTFASQNPGGPLNQLILNPGLQFSVTAGDLSVGGCNLAILAGGSDVPQAVAFRVLNSALHDRMGNSICFVRGPALVGSCQRH
jgi:hypothetical protein